MEIPDSQNVIAAYPIAVLKATKHRRAARAFVTTILSAAGQRVLVARGFLPGA